MIHRVEISAWVRPGVCEYRGTYAGEAYSGFSREPLLEACRALKRMGADTADKVCLFRTGKSDWDLRCSVGWGAVHTVDEARTGFAKWKPYPSVSRETDG